MSTSKGGRGIRIEGEDRFTVDIRRLSRAVLAFAMRQSAADAGKPAEDDAEDAA